MMKRILMALSAFALFATIVCAHDYNLGYGEHDVQVNANKWVKITLSGTPFSFNPVSSHVFRMKYEDGQEFQVFPQSI